MHNDELKQNQFLKVEFQEACELTEEKLKCYLEQLCRSGAFYSEIMQDKRAFIGRVAEDHNVEQLRWKVATAFDCAVTVELYEEDSHLGQDKGVTLKLEGPYQLS